MSIFCDNDSDDDNDNANCTKVDSIATASDQMFQKTGFANKFFYLQLAGTADSNDFVGSFNLQYFRQFASEFPRFFISRKLNVFLLKRRHNLVAIPVHLVCALERGIPPTQKSPFSMGIF